MRFTQNNLDQKECTAKVMAWLHSCWLQMEAGRPVVFKPTYERRALFTEEIVDNMLNELKLLMEDEFKKYPGYHYGAQGIPQNGGIILIPTGFELLPRDQRWAVVMGIDEVMQAYRLEDVVATADVDVIPIPGTPAYYNEYYC